VWLAACSCVGVTLRRTMSLLLLSVHAANVSLLCTTGNSYDDAFDACMEAVTNKKGTLVHPFNDKLIIAGQGTIGLEILNQAPDIDVIVAPVGGRDLSVYVCVCVCE
jgi:threonine dehydratase